MFSNRIVGYSIDSRMKSSLAVQALEKAAAVHGDIAGRVVQGDRRSQFRSRKLLFALPRHLARWIDRPSRLMRGQRGVESFFALLKNNVLDRRATGQPLTAPEVVARAPNN